MSATRLAGLALGVALVATPGVTPAQLPEVAAPAAHRMTMLGLGRGWTTMGMAQVFPIASGGEPLHAAAPLDASELYLTQPALMLNVAAPRQRLVLRTTLNFEAWTQPNGELTYGGWGEGFIDRRHPHTLLHEAMLSWNGWRVPGGAASISAGKGFAPYGTDDPMSRPAVKFPTNHHLSQVLERFTVNAVYLHHSGLSVEAGLFGGSEPTGPYDFSNIKSFGNSWSVRMAQRLGSGFGPFAPWELSASHARITEDHHGVVQVSHLTNAAIRHQQSHGVGDVYALIEASRSDVAGSDAGNWSVLAEARIGLGGGNGRHQPYARLELATRPEYARDGAVGSDGFWRYDHAHAERLGDTRWLITTIGYAVRVGHGASSARPFIELAHHRVRQAGGPAPATLFGRAGFWSASTGVRLHLGGDPMRMGSYGVLDPMSAAMRPAAPEASGRGPTAHGGHDHANH